MIGMKNREERAQHFFDTAVPLMDDGDDNTLYDRVREGAAELTAPHSRSALFLLFIDRWLVCDEMGQRCFR